MNLCIIAKDQDVLILRKIVRSHNIPELEGHTLLTRPCSPTGEKPITHWLCCMDASQDLYDRFKAIKTNYTDMEVCKVKKFLETRGLKLVGKRFQK